MAAASFRVQQDPSLDTSATKIVEGRTILMVPQESLRSHAPPRQPAFFNPHAKVCRDLSVLITKIFMDGLAGTVSVGDPLAGVGARAIRIANEVPQVDEVYINDLNPQALAYATESAKANGVFLKCRFSNDEACRFLIEHSLRGARLSFVDLDPFGSPSRFIDCGLRAVRDGGMLSVTATDSAVLQGHWPQVSLRRYYGQSLKNDYSREIGARLLAAFVIREAARLDLSAKPIFAHTKRLYTRLYFKVTDGATVAMERLTELGYLNHCFTCDTRTVTDRPDETCPCGSKFRNAGPICISNLHDPQLLSYALAETLDQEIRTLLERALQETDMPPHYYLLDKEASKVGRAPPKASLVMEEIRSQGYRATRCSFDPKGFKTDAPAALVRKTVRAAGLP